MPRSLLNSRWSRRQMRSQEFANVLTHGVAALLSVFFLALLIVAAANLGNARHVVGFSIFGSAMTFLFTASTLRHLYSQSSLKNLYDLLDYAAIFVLIAGTYTPFCLVILRGGWRWAMLGSVWAAAAAGIAMPLVWGRKFQKHAAAIYLAMGWLIIIAIRPLSQNIGQGGLALLFGGGLAYSLGVLVLATDRLPYSHAIWHLFVGLGALLHLNALLFYVLSRN